jgi:hypothetical protein
MARQSAPQARPYTPRNDDKGVSMKRIVIAFCLASSATTLPAQESPKITAAAIAASAKATEETADQETPPPTTEEVSGKVDALTEAVTEIRNNVDALSKMKLSGYIQGQFVHDDTSVDALSSPTATRNKDQFSIRRGRVKFTYQFSPTSKFVIQPDITSSGVVLKDGYVEFTEQKTPWHHTLTAGQFNWPFGFEIMYSSSDREMPERTRVVRTLFPGERDRGVMASGLGLNDRFNYRIAIVNGTGTAQSFDFNKRKDIVGRVGGNLGPVDLGVSIYQGSDLVSVGGATSGREFDKTRQGIDFQWFTPIRGLGVRGEYIVGKQPPVAGVTGANAASADVTGYYLYAIQNIGTQHQIVLRYDSYDPNSGHKVPVSAALAKVDTIGASYIFHWDANSKVMAAYEWAKTQNVHPDPKDNIFTLRYQYKF